jgi:thiol-disulfide isomerase/thioredoxin
MNVLVLVAFAIVADVRRAELPAAEKIVTEYRAQHGVTPEYVEAYSWLGRKALASRDYASASRYAAETHKLVLAELKKRPLDADAHLPIALGAAIEVQAQAAAARGERDQAVTFLREELKRYGNTSIRMRLQKNLNLLTLEARPALAIHGVPARELRGRPSVVFLWAHWCGDCKSMAPAIARLRSEFPDVQVIAPTQRYGYVGGGRDAGADEEGKYIETVWKEAYGAPLGVRVVVDQETFRNYGVSTTPTIVLIDAAGIVRLYHPGKMSWDELAKALRGLTTTPIRPAA